jgi:hypothetical protein
MSGTLLFFMALLMLGGCSQLPSGRTYLSEMEHDDSRFFKAAEDFPVVVGDNGQFWNTEDEQKSRTPASEHDLVDDRRAQALKQELRSLEGAQSEDGLEFYRQHEHQLATVSEKIYFLKLPPFERRDYLMTRGFISEPKQIATVQERMFATRQRDILLGMNKQDVVESWGKPIRVEVAGNPQNENERWLYKMNGASKFIYFEAGEVQGWE